MTSSPELPVFAPVSFTSAPADEVVEMVELFNIDGKAYMVPAKPRPNLALQVIDEMDRLGPDMAQVMLLKKFIGDDGFRDLAACTGVTREKITALGEAVTKLTMGAIEDEAAAGN